MRVRDRRPGRGMVSVCRERAGRRPGRTCWAQGLWPERGKGRVRGEQWPDWGAEVTPRTVMGFPGPDIPSHTWHHSGETHLQLCWERTLRFLSFSKGWGEGGKIPKM